MSLQDVVSIRIDRQTASISRAGFGMPMVLSTEAVGIISSLVAIYTEAAQLITAGFDANGATYKKAQALFSQNPRPEKIMVGKRNHAPLMTLSVVPEVKNTQEYKMTILGEVLTFTSDADATLGEVITGIVNAINTGSKNVKATDVGPGASFTIESADAPGGTPTAGAPFTVEFDEPRLFASENITADPGILLDITEVRTAIGGSDDWYVLILDSYGKAEVMAAAAAIETIRKVFSAISDDADVLANGVGNVAAALQALAYARTFFIYHQKPSTQCAEAAWDGDVLPTEPGEATWKFKQLKGVEVSVLTPTEETNLKKIGANYYIEVGGQGMTTEGVVVEGEYIDVIRDIDFIAARTQEDVFAEFIKLPKVPYTDKGVGVVTNAVTGVMGLGVTKGIFTSDPPPVVSAPLVADVDPTTRANRLLPDVKFGASLAGAIHAADITGIVSV